MAHVVAARYKFAEPGFGLREVEELYGPRLAWGPKSFSMYCKGFAATFVEAAADTDIVPATFPSSDSGFESTV